MRAWIGLLVLAVLLGGCSFAEDNDRGERAAARFHQLFDASQYAEIFVDTTEGFREAATEAEFVEFLGAARRKPGNVRACVLGIATERFVWVLDGVKARLGGYEIDSKELMLR